jgi:hypothetical protein
MNSDLWFVNFIMQMVKFQWVKIPQIKKSIVLLLFGMLAMVFETDFEIWQNFVNWKCDKTYEDNAVLGPLQKQWNAKMQFWSKTNSIAAVTFHSNTFKRNCVFFRLFFCLNVKLRIFSSFRFFCVTQSIWICVLLHNL